MPRTTPAAHVSRGSDGAGRRRCSLAWPRCARRTRVDRRIGSVGRARRAGHACAVPRRRVPRHQTGACLPASARSSPGCTRCSPPWRRAGVLGERLRPAAMDRGRARVRRRDCRSSSTACWPTRPGSPSVALGAAAVSVVGMTGGTLVQRKKWLARCRCCGAPWCSTPARPSCWPCWRRDVGARRVPHHPPVAVRAAVGGASCCRSPRCC